MAEPRKPARSKTTGSTRAAANRQAEPAAAATDAVSAGAEEVTQAASDVADTAAQTVGTAAAAVAPPPSAPVPPPPPSAPVPPPPPTAAAVPVADAATETEGPPPGANVAAAISGLMTGIKERMSTAELLLGTGALLVLGLSYVLFGFLLDGRRPSEVAVIAALVLLVLIGLERSQRQGFGEWYRVALVLLGVVVAGGAAYSFLNTLRSGFSFLDLWGWLGLLSWWAGGVLAAVGAWMAYRARA
ncbi:MAG: hypothetical protein KF809_11205 [Chloroflexi bacterium]|nr:hypothetical protein [Chloroflexota bacterium]